MGCKNGPGNLCWNKRAIRRKIAGAKKLLVKK
jgi:hypothetical protein